MTHALEPRRGRDARNTWGPRVFAQSPIPRRRPTRPFGDFRAFPHHTRPLGGRARAGVGRASPRDARYERGCRRRRAPRDVAFSARPPSVGTVSSGQNLGVARPERTPEMHKGAALPIDKELGQRYSDFDQNWFTDPVLFGTNWVSEPVLVEIEVSFTQFLIDRHS